MNLPLAYHPNVEEDIKDAYRWHEEQRASLGQEFLDAIEEVFDSLLHSPRRHGIVYQENRLGNFLPKISVRVELPTSPSTTTRSA